MNKLTIALILSTMAFTSLAQQSVEAFSPPTFEKIPNVRDLSITADGTEMYFTAQSVRQDFSAIMVSKKTRKGWSQPEVASFSGQFMDIEPFLSKDGLTLYFASNRPVEGRKAEKPNYDIWKVNRASLVSAWSAPTNLGAPVNTEADEFYPSIAASGNLYFTAQREGTKGKEDIFISRFKGGNYEAPESLPEAINSSGYEFNAFVDFNESYILFTGYGREDGLGGGDLYISRKNEKGEWQPARHIEAPVNSNSLDYCPYTFDGALYFTSNRSNLKPTYEKALTTEELLSELNQVANGKSRIYYVKWED